MKKTAPSVCFIKGICRIIRKNVLICANEKNCTTGWKAKRHIKKKNRNIFMFLKCFTCVVIYVLCLLYVCFIFVLRLFIVGAPAMLEQITEKTVRHKTISEIKLKINIKTTTKQKWKDMAKLQHFLSIFCCCL